MEKVINVLLFEENDVVFQDVKQHCLSWAPNCVLTRANKRKSLEGRLKWMNYNLILAGFSQSSLSAIDLLFYLRDVHAHCPLVFILDESSDYNSADTAVMKHAAVCLYRTDFQRKSFLIEEAMQKSLPKLHLQLAADRKLLETVIREGRAKFELENIQEVDSLQEGNSAPKTGFAFEMVKKTLKNSLTAPSAGNQVSDATGVSGEDPDFPSGLSTG